MAFRAAVVSTARRSQCYWAAAASCRWRRLLSSGRAISEVEVERVVERKVREILDGESKVPVHSTEVDQLMQQTVRQKLMDYPSTTNPSQEVLLVENLLLKRAVEMEKRLNEQRLLLSTKLSDAELKINRSHNDTRSAITSFCIKCNRKALVVAHTVAVLEEKHKIFVDDVNDRTLQAEINIVKAIAYVISVQATLLTMYLWIKG